jgi:hypothetical protein
MKLMAGLDPARGLTPAPVVVEGVGVSAPKPVADAAP